MPFPIQELHRKTQSNSPFAMDTHIENQHVIDIASSSTTNPSSAISSNERPQGGADNQFTEDHPSTSSRNPAYQPSRNPRVVRRGNSRARQRSSFDSTLWISAELVLTVSQIIAAITVLSWSKHGRPGANFTIWVVGYGSGCLASLPLLYWRFKHRNQGSTPESPQRMDSSQGNNSGGPLTRRVMEGEGRRASTTVNRGNQSNVLLNWRLNAFVEYFKMGLNCFFALWFIQNLRIFREHSSSSEAPTLYRFCIVFLTFSSVVYAMRFIMCPAICCPGFREDFAQNRGATQDSINSLPTYKFKLKKKKSGIDKEIGTIEGGVVAAGTEKERAIPGEDAVCCICLAKYVNNDELCELPCSHFFHKACVDEWLKINASCPLCKAEVG